jgi:hypothetical protein
VIYQVSLIKDHCRPSSNSGIAAIRAHQAELETQGIRLYGIFAGLLGLATNEIYVVTYSPQPHSLQATVTAAGLELEASHEFLPTARPTEHAPLTKPGIYVFRWFKVKNTDVKAIVELSTTAWKSFEAGFQTQVQGLFAEPESAAVFGQMLLITRYADLSVWEASRHPSDEARENFQRRHTLTIEAKPIATQLAL